MLDTSMLQSTNLPKDKSYIFLTAHIGNWELLGYIFTLNGYILNILAREGNNSLIEKNITLNSRHRFGAKTIYKKRAGISFVRALKRGESVGVLIDQKAGLVNGVMTKFFDRDVTTASLIANIKLKLDVDIVPLFLVRDGNKFKLIIRDKIEYKAEEIENQNDKIVAMTQRYNDEIERIVREYPMQWFWMHNRWKI
jgi:KDO2-lipid IV(A) lauroyltransferase